MYYYVFFISKWPYLIFWFRCFFKKKTVFSLCCEVLLFLHFVWLVISLHLFIWRILYLCFTLFFQKWLKWLNEDCITLDVSPRCLCKKSHLVHWNLNVKKMCIFHRTLPTCKVYVDIANCCCNYWTCYLFLYISYFHSVSLYMLLPLFSQQCFGGGTVTICNIHIPCANLWKFSLLLLFF